MLMDAKPDDSARGAPITWGYARSIQRLDPLLSVRGRGHFVHGHLCAHARRPVHDAARGRAERHRVRDQQGIGRVGDG